MIRVSVRCSCGDELANLERETFREALFDLQSALVTCHAAVPHCQHHFAIEIDPESCEDGKTLKIECVEQRNCKMEKVRTWENVPLELVGALTLVFHTSHEGHPLRVKYGDDVWASPRRG